MIPQKVGCTMTKREARALAKVRRAELDMQAVGCGMARALFALPCWAAADTVLAFAAMPDEPDTAAMLRRTLADGKRSPARPWAGAAPRWTGWRYRVCLCCSPVPTASREPPADPPAADPGGDAATLARRSLVWLPGRTACGWAARWGHATVFWHSIRGKGRCSARQRPCWRIACR